MKVGILTYHRSHNYGAFLQAYSLSNAINSIEGIECELINYNLIKEDNLYKKIKLKKLLYFSKYYKQDRMFNEAQKYQLLSDKLILDDNYEEVLSYADQKYDVVIVGSDEIWRIASRGFPNAYWLPGKHKFVKMSYAASGRNTESRMTKSVKEQMIKIYEDFSYIGVRDNITKKQIEELNENFKVRRNCDPAFLYDKYNKNKEELKEAICKKYKLNKNKKIITFMYDRIDAISSIRKVLGTKEYQYICITRPMINATKNLCSVNPFDWVDIIGGSDYLVSSYFHGMLFAINQDTPFVVVDRRATRKNIETSKLFDFLSYEKMDDRYYLSSEMDVNDWNKIALRIKQETLNSNISFKNCVNNQKELFDDFKQELIRIKNEREKKIS